VKRALAVLAVLALAGVAAFAASGAGGEAKGRQYKVVFDNAFGLTEGVDLRVGGVRAGSVDTLDIERGTGRALVTVSVTSPGFAAFRTDAFCSIRPQSLVGEYFMDCQPGTTGRELPSGGTLKVERTETTIPPDLVQSVLRRPYRERFGLILNELGGAFAGRGPDLNETIRRAVPALTQTNRALAVLEENKEELQSLTRESATVLDALADRRTDVSRFVSEARDAAAISASRRTDLALTFNRLPAFLSELRPTLANLGTAAEQQAPALTDLSNSAASLTTFFNRLGPFAEATRPALRSLGEASKIGSRAAVDARPTIQQVSALTKDSGELSTNLAMVLEHLESRDNAVEKFKDSPGGEGFTGLEAIVQYPFVQSQATNIFDQRGYILKLLILANECSQYTNAETAKEDPERTKRCSAALGPNQPGINQPDPSGAAQRSARSARTGSSVARKAAGTRRSGGADRSAPGEDRPAGTPAPAPSGANPSPTPAVPGPAPAAPAPAAPTDAGLLDFLFGP